MLGEEVLLFPQRPLHAPFALWLALKQDRHRETADAPLLQLFRAVRHSVSHGKHEFHELIKHPGFAGGGHEGFRFRRAW